MRCTNIRKCNKLQPDLKLCFYRSVVNLVSWIYLCILGIAVKKMIEKMIERSLVVCVFILSQGKISKPFGMLDPKLGYHHSLIT